MAEHRKGQQPPAHQESRLPLVLIALLFLGILGVAFQADLSARRRQLQALIERDARELHLLGWQLKQLRSQAPKPATANNAPATETPTRAATASSRMDAFNAFARLHNLGGKAGLKIQSLFAAVQRGEKPTAFAIGADLALPPGFGDLFGLDSEATNQFQQKLQALKQRVDDAILQHTSVTEENDVVSLHLTPLESSESLQGEFRSLLRTSLGEDGASALAAFNNWPDGGLEALFLNFGAEARTISIRRSSSLQEGKPQRQYTLDISVGARRSGATVDSNRRQVLLNYLGAMGRALPENF
jgi:hypothetical protein